MSERGEEQEPTIPCPEGRKTPLADGCNRRPFLSEGDCDRGEVDIHLFDDFPICGPINPTPPEIPPNLVETQWVLPTPPACTCVDIDYKFKFGGYKDEFNAKGEFRSVGDCCEGEYETEFNFDLPCPIGDFGEKKIKVSTGWNCDSKDEQTYIKPCEDECCIDPSDIDIKVGLPCPIDGNGDSEISIKLDWDKEKSQKKKFLTSKNSEGCGDGEADDCQLTPENPEFEIGLPCPIPEDLESKKVTIKTGWNCSTSDEKPIIKKCNDDCCIDVKESTFHIGLPCPIDGDGDSKISIKLGWDKSESQTENFLTSKNSAGCGDGGEDDCKITPANPEFEIGLPCPIPDTLNDKKVKIKIDWKDKREDEAPIIKKVADECSIDVDTTGFDIGLPCPIPDDKKVEIKIDWTDLGDDSKKDDKQSVIKKKADDCSIDTADTTFNIGLPCPIPTSFEVKAQVKIDWEEDKKESKYVTLLKKSDDDCAVETDGPQTMEIGLPCPIPSSMEAKVKAEVKWGDEPEKDEITILKKGDDDCTLEVPEEQETLSLALPCPIPTSFEVQTQVKIDWNDKKESEIVTLLKKSGDDCLLEAGSSGPQAIEIGLPCPIPSSMEAKVKAEVKWGESSEKDEITILKKGDDDCVLEVPAEQETLSLALPCPIPEEPGSVEIQIAYGSDFEGGKYDIAHQSEDSDDSCKLEFDNPTFELRIPCPLDNLVLSGEVEESKESSSGESGDWNIEVIDDDESGDEDQSDDSGSDVAKECSKKLKIKLTVPEDKCTTVITGIHFDPDVMDIVYTTAEICGKFTTSEDSGGKNLGLPIAGHVNKCCGEKSDS